VRWCTFLEIPSSIIPDASDTIPIPPIPAPLDRTALDDTTCGTHEVLLFDLTVLALADVDAVAAAASREVMVNGEVQAVLFDSVAVTLTDAGSVTVVVPLRSDDR